jgi:hypothetical protein
VKPSKSSTSSYKKGEEESDYDEYDDDHIDELSSLYINSSKKDALISKNYSNMNV